MKTIPKIIIYCCLVLGVFTVKPSSLYAATLDVDSSTYNFPSISTDDFDAGYIKSLLATTLTVVSSSSWQVDVKTDSVNMGGYGKSISDFLVKKNGNPTFLVISDTNQELDSGSNGTFNIDVDYKMLLDWVKDAPNTYSITVKFTLTTE